MLVLKGALLVFALSVIALIAFLVLGRGGMFDTRFFTKTGAFLIGIGLGTGILGFGLLFLGRAALAHFARVAQ